MSRASLLHQPPIVIALLAACDTRTKLSFYGATPFVNFVIEESVLILDLFIYGCRHGYATLVRRMIAKGVDNWNLGMYYACTGGHYELVEMLIAKGATDWNIGLVQACQGGYREIANLMIVKGADAWNLGLGKACAGCQPELAEMMISKGATYCPSCRSACTQFMSGPT